MAAAWGWFRSAFLVRALRSLSLSAQGARQFSVDNSVLDNLA
jgi:hypothetical protein